MSFENDIAELCLNHFKALPKTGKPKDNEWTVLSCIVKQQNHQFEIVALGTGSKCIGRSKLCPKGTILNDSHAEVICRRSFLRYLYGQMFLEDSNLLEFDSNKSKFRLKDGVKFHFFTTHTPCGDSVIFPKQNLEDLGQIIQNNKANTVDTEDAIPCKKRKVDDIFRTGAKCLENDAKQDPKLQGEAYHVMGVVRTKPGRGDPTLSVSCSDKLAKWCHLGVQGALLSILLESPIYLSSFIIAAGTPFCEEALQRALYTRLKGVDLKQPLYSQHKMEVYLSNKKFQYGNKDNKSACPASISWAKMVSERSLEVAVEGKKQGVTKKNVHTETGRLKICKLELFKMFISVCKKCNIDIFIKQATYNNMKSSAIEYQNVWQNLRKSFKIWTHKNVELLEFCSE